MKTFIKDILKNLKTSREREIQALGGLYTRATRPPTPCTAG